MSLSRQSSGSSKLLSRPPSFKSQKSATGLSDKVGGLLLGGDSQGLDGFSQDCASPPSSPRRKNDKSVTHITITDEPAPAPAAAPTVGKKRKGSLTLEREPILISFLIGGDSQGTVWVPQKNIYVCSRTNTIQCEQILAHLEEARDEWNAVEGATCEIVHTYCSASLIPTVVGGLTQQYKTAILPKPGKPLKSNVMSDEQPSAKKARRK
jgi:hypothetical protein